MMVTEKQPRFSIVYWRGLMTLASQCEDVAAGSSSILSVLQQAKMDGHSFDDLTANWDAARRSLFRNMMEAQKGET